MLQISDVVETSYVKDEKMLDLRGAEEKPGQHGSPSADQPPDDAGAAGFEDYLAEKPSKTQPSSRAAMPSGDTTPGFEDYMEQQTRELSAKISPVSGRPQSSDTPGFEDYLD